MGTAPPLIFGIAGAALWLFSGKAFQSRDIYLKNSWFRPVLLLMILPWFGLLYTPDLSGLGFSYARKTHYWIYGLAIASIINKNIKPEQYINAFLLGLAVNAFIGTLQLIGLYPSNNGWYCGTGRGYSTLSAYLIAGILIASFYFRKENDKRKKYYYAFLMIFYFFHLSILDGRTGYITFFALFPMIIYNIFDGKHIFKILCSSIIIIGLMFLSPVVQKRVKLSVDQLNYHLNAGPDIAWGKAYTANQDRFYMWRGAVRLFMENPFLGTGTGGYQDLIMERGKPEDPLITHPHNDFLYMAASYGLAGIFAFIWLFYEIIKNSWKQKHTVPGYFILSTAFVILISGLFNGQTIDAGMAFLLAVIVGIQQSFPTFNSFHKPDKLN